jgi:poly-beta-1,6-N-acetyl-D-glucosamine synthase
VIKILFQLSIFLIIYTYFIYPAILWMHSKITAGRINKVVFEDLKPIPNVTMLISAYNEEDIIVQKLDNCLKINYPIDKLEIIIASDGSTDNTNLLVNEYKSDRISFIDLPRMGKVNVLNKIALKSKSEILVFSDANTIYDPNALIELVKYFSNEKIGCVCGNLQLINSDVGEIDGESTYWKYEKWIKTRESKLGVVVGANGAIFAVRRNLFELMPSNTINDDFHISMKIFEKGYDIVFSKNAIGTEFIAKDFISEFKRHVRDGAGHYREILHFLSLLSPLKGKRFFSYFSHRIIRWFVPFLLIIVFISNIFLLDSFLYKTVFIVQCIFYILVMIALILKTFNSKISILNLPLFFISTNIALLIGFIKNILGKQDVKWDSTERVQSTNSL